jgi:pimeloyl-ACP methyl ester carboxylesterase
VRTLLAAAAAALVLAAPAGAAVTTIASPGPGPSRYDKVTVTKIGPASAKTVLLLMPGFQGGAGDFSLIGRDIVKRVGGVQVWALDRRSQALEDTSRFRDALAGRITPKQAYDYYAGWIADSSIQPHFQPVDGKALPYARDWGLTTTLNDVHRVVLKARAAGKRVILGGHSLGASMTAAYASWDFGGRAGYKDVDGLVLIDGGLLGSFSTPTLAQTKRRYADLQKSDPFVDLLGLGLPWAAGVLAETAAIAGLKEPTAPSLLQASPLVPAQFKGSQPTTNRGAFGYAFDATTSPKALELIQLRMGTLGPDGDWRDGEVTPIARGLALFGQEPANATEWYFPKRLTLDVDAANALTRNAQTKLLGLRPWHRAGVDVPLYAFQTSLTKGHVLRGARRLIAASQIPRGRSVLVDASATQSHLDPLAAAPARNRFLQTVVPFLKRLR